MSQTYKVLLGERIEDLYTTSNIQFSDNSDNLIDSAKEH